MEYGDLTARRQQPRHCGEQHREQREEKVRHAQRCVGEKRAQLVERGVAADGGEHPERNGYRVDYEGAREREQKGRKNSLPDELHDGYLVAPRKPEVGRAEIYGGMFAPLGFRQQEVCLDRRDAVEPPAVLHVPRLVEPQAHFLLLYDFRADVLGVARLAQKIPRGEVHEQKHERADAQHQGYHGKQPPCDEFCHDLIFRPLRIRPGRRARRCSRLRSRPEARARCAISSETPE